MVKEERQKMSPFKQLVIGVLFAMMITPALFLLSDYIKHSNPEPEKAEYEIEKIIILKKSE